MFVLTIYFQKFGLILNLLAGYYGIRGTKYFMTYCYRKIINWCVNNNSASCN